MQSDKGIKNQGLTLDGNVDFSYFHILTYKSLQGFGCICYDAHLFFNCKEILVIVYLQN